jgi:hypothetical protein
MAYAPKEGQAMESGDSELTVDYDYLPDAQIMNIKPVTPSVLPFLQFFQILHIVSYSLTQETNNRYCGMSFFHC